MVLERISIIVDQRSLGPDTNTHAGPVALDGPLERSAKKPLDTYENEGSAHRGGCG